MPLRPDPPQSRQHHADGEQAAHALTEECRPRDTCDAHFERRDKQDVQTDVGRGRCGKEPERRLGIAEGRENARRNVIKEYERQAPDIDIQIQLGVSEHVFRRPDRMQEQIAAEQTDQHQHCADCGAGDHRRIDRCLHAVILLRAEKARDDHRAADVAAERERDENERHLIAVADRGQRVLPDELARDKAVGDVVKLLKNDACKQRQAEPCQHG